MPAIQACPLPPQALLRKYADADAYTDCYSAEVPRSVSHAEFVEVFYTGALFRIERLLLSLFLSRPSTDVQAKQLAVGERSTFAAWRVEDRATDQLLLCDVAGRTRSWLMVDTASTPHATRLYFGSAVVPIASRSTGKPAMSFAFKALLGFHKLYSRALLGSARSRLAADRTRAQVEQKRQGP
jgi:hypothetical protein